MQAVINRAGICVQHLGTCDQGEAAPPLSSQGMPPQKPGLANGSCILVTWKSLGTTAAQMKPCQRTKDFTVLEERGEEGEGDGGHDELGTLHGLAWCSHSPCVPLQACLIWYLNDPPEGQSR